jgi:pimeloyl-ACP methyl ester carboxylesterase
MSSRGKTTSAVPRSKIQAPSDSAPRIDRQGFAVGRDHTPIFYRVSGPAAAGTPPVVFCDGIGCDGYVWKYLEKELTRGRRVVHWHYRGHGRTPPPRDPRRVDVEDLADDLAGVMDAALGDGSAAVLAGHSMGVQVCLEAYRRHPGRVAGLVLLCGSYGTPLRTFKGKATLEQVLPYVRFMVNRIPGLVAGFWKRVIPTELAFQLATRFELNGELIRREDFIPYLEHIAQVDVRLFLEMLAAAGRHTAREILEHIEVPTLIVSGGRDGFTPANLSEEMHQLIKNSELFVVPDGSHTAPIERPAEVTERIADFLRKQF